jgi:hypothetical protein
MSKNSSRRHHYIPQFLIKGFTDEKGMLYIYDKVNDKILKQVRPPKSIFYEYERNTIEINNFEKSAFLEDIFYKKVDDSSAKTIRSLQTSIINDDFFLDEITNDFQFFIINLFWRLPKTDYAVKDLIERAEIKVNDENINDDIKKDPSFSKLIRAKLFKETFEQFEDQNNRPKGYKIQVSEFKDDLFLIGDYPIIFRNHMSKFTDLMQSEFKMAISSKRIISFSLNSIPSFKHNNFLKYNALIIEQSMFYAASNDIRILRASIEYYKTLKDRSWQYQAKELLFK